MRKITPAPIVTFFSLLAAAIILATITNVLLLGYLPLGDFRGVVLTLAEVVLVYVFAILLYRIFLKYYPLKEGNVVQGSRDEFGYNVYILFYLLLFYPLTRSHFIPTPLMRLVYLALGCKMGPNTYSAGAIMDPPLTKLGANTIVGHAAVLVCHTMEGDRLSHGRITVGDNVTIGGFAMIGAGTVIEDGATIVAGSGVYPGTHIGPGEIWAGNPARRRRGGQPNQTTDSAADTPSR